MKTHNFSGSSVIKANESLLILILISIYCGPIYKEGWMVRPSYVPINKKGREVVKKERKVNEKKCTGVFFVIVWFHY